jgi:RNA polymerase sigma-70 factor (ECF subfamily)
MDESEGARREAFEALVREHHVRVRVFVRSLGVDADWVDDLAQEAFLVAYRTWDAYDPGRDFGRWVRGIAANLVRNEIRKDARRRRILHERLSELLLESRERSGEGVGGVELEAVQECLGELGPTSRGIVLGRYRDGQTATELAALYGQTPENVRQMLLRIRRQIRECIERRTLGEA